jgi:hypothetical protein
MSSSINLMLRKLFALPVIGIISSACASAYPNISEIKNPPPLTIEPVVGLVDHEKVVKIELEEKEWKCPGCNENEKYVLGKIQERTNISDRNALATILGNIKSESNFHANICEGGSRVSYDHCYSGGYGLIQWTSTGRYLGLGSFCKKYDCDPSSLEGQVRYMINESHFQKVLPEFEGNGQTVSQYMVAAYYWLGWGIKGYREQYAYDYTKKMIWS